MSLPWLTSAAVVGILVSTVIFMWQRNLEHRFLLRKEKRELFARVLRQNDLLFHDLLHGKMDDPSYVAYNENSLEASNLLSLLRLYDAPGVFLAFRNLIQQYQVEVSRGVRADLSPKELLVDLHALRDELDDEMKQDLAATVSIFPFLQRRRYRFKPHTNEARTD